MTDNPNDRVDENFKDKIAREKEELEARRKRAEEAVINAQRLYAKVCEVLSDFAKLQGASKPITEQEEFKNLFGDVITNLVKETVADLEALNSDITSGQAAAGVNPMTGQPVLQEVRMLKITFNSALVEVQIKMNMPISQKKQAAQQQPSQSKVLL